MLKTEIKNDWAAEGVGQSPEPADRTKSAGPPTVLLRGFVVLSGAVVLITHLGLVNRAVRADQYRHLSRIVLPVFVEHDSVELLWSNHHPSPFLHLYQFVSVSVFSFDQRLDFTAGVIGSIAVGWMLVDAALARRREAGGQPIATSLTILVAAVVVSRASPVYTTWPLVTFQILFIAFGMAFQKRLLSNRFTDAARSENADRFALRCAEIGFLTLGLLLIHGTIGTFFAGGAALTLVTSSIIERRDRVGAGRLWLIAGVVTSTIAGYRLVVGRFASASGSNVSIDPGEAAGQLPHILDYVRTLGAHILEPTIVFEFVTLHTGTGRAAIHLVAGLTTVAVVAFASRDLRRNGFLVASALTLMVMLAGTAVTAATRNPDLQIWAGALAAPRYDHYFALMLAVLLALVARLVEARPTSNLGLLITGALLIEVAALSYRNVIPSEELALRSLAVANREELLTYMEGSDPANDFSLTGTSAGNNGAKVYEPVLQWMYRNQINVFDSDQVLHRQAEAYKSAESIISTSSNRERAIPGADGCVRLTATGGAVAWQAGVDVTGAGRWHVRVIDDGNGEILDQFELVPGRMNLLGLAPAREVVRVCPSDQAQFSDFHYSVATD